MIEVNLPDGSIGEFPDGMSEEQITAVLRAQFPPAATWGEVPNITLGQLGSLGVRGATMVGQGGGQFIEDAIGWNPLTAATRLVTGSNASDEELKGAAFAQADKWGREFEQYMNPRGARMGMGKSLAGAAASFPLQIAAAPFQAADVGQQMVNLGETNTGNIQTAMAVNAVGNAASLGLPASAPGGIIKRGLSGGGMNTLMQAGMDQFTKDLSETEAAKKAFDPLTPEGMERALQAGVMGAGLGMLGGQRGSTKAAPPSKSIDALNEIAAKKKKGEPTVENTPESILDYKQQDLAIEPPDVDASGIRNPYDLGGQVSDTAAGLDTMLDSPQGDLFAQGLRESAQKRPEVIAARETFNNEAMGLEARIKAAMFILDNYNIYRGKVYNEAKRTINELIAAHEANRNEYARGMDMLDQEKPRDALGRPLYDQPEFLVQPGGVQEGPPVTIEGPKFTAVPPVKRVPKKQKGAINPSTLTENFYSEKDLGDGYVLRAYAVDSYKPQPYGNLRIRIFKNGTDIGGVEFAVDKPFGPASEASLKADDMPFINEGERGQGLASSLYAYASELGNDIRQDKTNTPSGQGMWNRMGREGLARGDTSEGVREGFIPAGRRVSDAFVRSQTSQRGMWLPFSEGPLKMDKDPAPTKQQEMVTEVERTAKLLEDDTDGRQNVINNVGAEGVDLIEADKPVTPELVDQILAEPDVGSGVNFISGALSKAILNSSTGVLAAYRWFANAKKRAERFDRDYVRPAADAVKSFMGSTEKLTVFKTIFDKELEMGSRFSAEELKAAGISDKMINAYAGFRRMFDASLELQNKARAEAGLPPIKELEAYVASRWNGPYRATVLDKDGNLVWQVAEPTALGARRAINWLKANVDPDLKIGKITYNENYGRQNAGLQAGYVEMVNLLGTDHPITARIKELLESTAAFTTENVMGQEKHFKKKTGVRGFAGDRPWAKNDPKDWVKEQLQYAKNAATWAEQQSAIRNTKELLANPDLITKKENLALYLKEYMNNQRGFGTKDFFNKAEQAVSQALGISPAHLDKLLGISKSVFYITKLGMLNLPFTAAQLIQPIFTAPYHSVLTTAGYTHNAAKSALEGLSNTGTFTIVHMLRAAGKDEMAANMLKRMPEIFRDAALYAEQNGVIDVNQFSDIKDLERPKALRIAESIAGFNIKASEQLARTNAFMTFVSHLDQSGKFADTFEGRMELFQKAEEATRFTMVDYNPSERALLFQKAGVTGNALSTLQTFKLNQLNQMVKYIDDLRNGNPAPALQFFGLYFLMGGLTGFVGIEDADALYEMMKSILSDDQMAALPKEIREFGVKKAIMEMPEMISMGPVSALTGINIYSRFDSSNILPLENSFGDSLASLFPFAKDQIAQAGGLKDLFSGDPKKRLAGGYALMPSAAKGLYENMAPQFTNPQGVVGRGTNPAEGDYTRTPEERELRNYGFRSTKEARTKELNFRNQRIQKDMAQRRANIAEKIGNQILFSSVDNLEDSVKSYIRLGGDPRNLVTEAKVLEKFRNKNTDRLQKLRMAALSGKAPAVSDLLRYMESLGVQ